MQQKQTLTSTNIDPHQPALLALVERCAGLRAQIARHIVNGAGGLPDLLHALAEGRREIARLDATERQIDEVLRHWTGTPEQAWDPKHPVDQRLWFIDTPERPVPLPEGIEARFEQAVAGDLEHWQRHPRGTLALMILLDQVPRHLHADTPRMVATDTVASRLAQSLRASEGDAELPPPARALAYLILGHSEDQAVMADALEGFFALVSDPLTRGQRRTYRHLLARARKDVKALERFGRHPIHNVALGRESTVEERCFLQQRRHPQLTPSPEPTGLRPARVLVLHGFRQNGGVLKAKTRKLRKALEGVAELVYVDAPHMCDPETPHLRRWWDAQETPVRYAGWSQTLTYLQEVFQRQGPFDGVVGFSQGGAVAALLGALQPLEAIQLRFVISISSFTPRDPELAPLMAQPLKLPSMHIYGERDEMVPPERSIALSRCFEHGALATHPGGHFAPDRWPMDTLQAFIGQFVHQGLPASLEDEEVPATHLVRPELLATWVDEDEALERWIAPVGEALRTTPGLTPKALLASACSLYQSYDYGPVDHIEAPLPGDAVYRLWMAAHLAIPGGVAPHLPMLLASCGVKALNRLALLACEIADEQPGLYGDGLMGLHQAVAEQIAATLNADEGLLEAGLPTSLVALGAPRINGATDRRCNLGRAVARRLSGGQDRRTAYARYRRLIAGLGHHIRAQEAQVSGAVSTRRLGVPEWTPEALTAPISEAVIEPLPVPVVPCPLDELAPLLEHLAADHEQVSQDTAFPRGTLTPDGRLDLCKQVVGPAGIEPLLSAVDSNPQVKRLLLGNNIVGNTGAGAIAEFIRSGQSPVQVWYIAGNHIDADGLAPICEALVGQLQVEGLWLKRNPIKASGAVHLKRLLKGLTGLVTLDLVNTGLLDEGVREIMEGVRVNTSLRHLYLGTNGITPEGIEPVVRSLAEGSRLSSLFVSCNRLGDVGATALAEALKADGARGGGLKRLSVASNRIGPDGAVALAEAVAEHPTLQMLSLGWNRATAAVGELGNRIGRRGCEAWAEVLRHNRTLRCLDVSHNGLRQDDVEILAEGAHCSSTLVGLRLAQYGERIEPVTLAALDEHLAGNQSRASVTAEEVWTPTPTREILSVYRTAD
ncbi:MAG: DUF924 family protein [Bradymonadia bacterium]